MDSKYSPGHAVDDVSRMIGDDKSEDSSDPISEAAEQLTDEQLEAELTIAAANRGLAERYKVLLAERDRRRSA